MSSLPEDIIENILTRLPVKSISRFRCVSKKWCLLFRNPRFIKNHLKHANLMNKFKILANINEITGEIVPPYLYFIDSTDPSSSSSSSPFLGHAIGIDFPFATHGLPAIYGSCDGLICLETYSERICIWNPATREYKNVRKPPGDDYAVAVAHGFGFDSKSDDYKILRIVENEASAEIFEASVYSLASNSWKNLGVIPYDFGQGLKNRFLHNDVLHFVASITHRPSRIVLSVVVVCFDLSDETFRGVPLPKDNSYEDTHPAMLGLGIWEGKLCLLRENVCGCPVDVWTMMDEKWSKHSSITAQIDDMIYYDSPIQTLQNGEILFLGGYRGEDRLHFISYDPKLERARAMKIHGFPGDHDEMETYIETLVPLNSGTYVGKKKKNKVPKKKEKNKIIVTDAGAVHQ